ncbi:MAG: hypothetical protein QQN63_04245 [Nitrosopumilus sp.]
MLNFLNAAPWTLAYAQIDVKETRLYINDGVAEQIEVKIGEGNFTWTETTNRDYILDRGLLDEVRDGDQAPVEVSFDILWDYIKGSSSTGAVPTIEEALKQIGNASSWVSSDSDACRPYSVDLVLVYDPSCTTGDVEKITFSDFRWESLDHDLRGGSIACSGKCNIVVPTLTRGGQTP